MLNQSLITSQANKYLNKLLKTCADLMYISATATASAILQYSQAPSNTTRSICRHSHPMQLFNDCTFTQYGSSNTRYPVYCSLVACYA